MARMILRPLKAWQRRARSVLLDALPFYRSGHVRRRLRRITETNAGLTVDIEQEILRLGQPAIPVLLWALRQDDFNDYQKRSILRVLVGIGDADALAALCDLADRDADALGRQARKDVRVLCLRLNRKGELPEEYRAYLDEPRG
jgi:hypothetical protein